MLPTTALQEKPPVLVKKAHRGFVLFKSFGSERECIRHEPFLDWLDTGGRPRTIWFDGDRDQTVVRTDVTHIGLDLPVYLGIELARIADPEVEPGFRWPVIGRRDVEQAIGRDRIADADLVLPTISATDVHALEEAPAEVILRDNVVAPFPEFRNGGALLCFHE